MTRNFIFRFATLYCSIIIAIAAPGCHSPQTDPTNDNLKKFKKLNAEILDHNKTVALENDYKAIYLDIKAQPGGAKINKADSIYTATQSAINLIDSLKKVLYHISVSGENLHLVTKVMVEGGQSEKLKNMIVAVHDATGAAAATKAKQQQVDSVFALTAKVLAGNDWGRQCFRNMPSMAAATLLTKMSDDCKSAAIIALKDINESIKRPS